MPRVPRLEDAMAPHLTFDSDDVIPNCDSAKSVSPILAASDITM